jgi:hypothetical protein
MKKKQLLGQFMTTNYKYILQKINIPDNIKNIAEPFCGEGDLINFIISEDNISKYELIECYDIDISKNIKNNIINKNNNIKITQKDTLKEPPIYTDKFILTNPPYLARNKSNYKEIFDKYNVNDLYKCFIKILLNDPPIGGILILPLNFWSSIRKNDIELRKEFLKKFDIIQLNIFEEQVFDDTSYTVCSFLFKIKNNNNDNPINIDIYPSKKNLKIVLNNNNNYMIGGEIYKLKIKNRYTITRITKNNLDKKNTNLLIKCIDDNINNRIKLSLVKDNELYIDNTPKQSARTYASLIIEPAIDTNAQLKLVNLFNSFLEKKRNEYISLFLTNYRESKDNNARKRISFDLVYKILIYLLESTF